MNDLIPENDGEDNQSLKGKQTVKYIKIHAQNFIYKAFKIISYSNIKFLYINHQVNTNFHYMIHGTRNFIGIEINQVFEKNKMNTVLRPQMRVGLVDNLLIGIVGGIPISKSYERLSSFIRIIYEPVHKHK